MRRILRALLVALTLMGMMIATAGPTLAAKPDVPPGRGGGVGGGRGNGGGGGNGNGGGPGEEVTPNSLSVPAIFVGVEDDPYGLICDGITVVLPTGDPLTGYSEPGYYYVQGFHSWQAQCDIAETTPNVAADWGDNLAGDARLKVGSPIRVELGLLAETVGMTGFEVVKLEPGELDRVSPYGTQALQPTAGTFAPDPKPIDETRVWSLGTWLTITPVVNGVEGTPIVDEAASAEINSTGRIVYGYNLRVGEPGTYRIHYDVPGVNITDVDRDELGNPMGSFTATSVTLDIEVGLGGGTGGGNGNH